MSLWQPSAETASSVYNAANLILVGSLVFGLIATVFIFWMGNAKERYSNVEVARANESAELAKEGAAKANERAAELEKQNIELRAKFSNRHITKEQYDVLVEELSKAPAEFDIWAVTDPESRFFAEDIIKVLTASG